MSIKTELVKITDYYDIGNDMYLSSVLESVKKKGITEDNIININRINASDKHYIEIIYRLDEEHNKLHDMEDILTNDKDNDGLYSLLYNDLVKDMSNKRDIERELDRIRAMMNTVTNEISSRSRYTSHTIEDINIRMDDTNNILQSLSSEISRSKYGRL